VSISSFEIIWALSGQELGRKTVTCEDLNEAVVAGWLSLPEIARAARKPCSTITVRNSATGETVIDDVPHDISPKPIWVQPLLLFAAGIGALFCVIWMGKHGFLKGEDGLNDITFGMIWAFPMGFILAIISLAGGLEQNRKVAEQWKKDYGDIRPPPLPERPRLHRVVVARFSLWRTIPALLLTLAIATACFWPIFHRFQDGSWEIWHPALMACGAWFFIFTLVPLYQILFEDRAAVWIEAGEIVYFNRHMTWRAIWGVREVALEPWAPPRGLAMMHILIKDAEDGVAPISHRVFSEDADIVVARLNRLLQLSPQTAAQLSAVRTAQA
jgi:hypothetical protein